MRTAALGVVAALGLSLAACAGAAPPKPPAGGDPNLIVLGVEPTAGRVLAEKAASLAVRIRISAGIASSPNCQSARLA